MFCALNEPSQVPAMSSSFGDLPAINVSTIPAAQAADATIIRRLQGLSVFWRQCLP